MLQPVKYFIFGALFIFLIVSAGIVSIKQDSTIRTVENVDVSLEAAQLGALRKNYKQGVIDKEEVVSEIITEISKDAKKHDGDMKIDYVFLDSSGNKTTQEKLIDSIQFRLQLLNKDDEVVSETIQRYSLKDGG